MYKLLNISQVHCSLVTVVTRFKFKSQDNQGIYQYLKLDKPEY